MASFTDKTPRFNPYIQQLPVEAMAQVGMAKQKAHDEGVQKIQAQIDSMAGLQVGRDVDKAYLQSKMNELGNNLRTFAAGDFSNFQLVNSVGGMVNQVGNDPYIKAAVSSTANDAKQMAAMEADRAKGTLTPHAEYYYAQKRNKYYNSTELSSPDGKPVSFSGKYVQSWDIDKNILDAIKAVGDSKWSADNVFVMVNGQIAKDANGAPIYSDYATREIRQGKFSENVAAAIDGVLSRPEAAQELAMRGVYKYRGYNKVDDFVNKYQSEKNKAVTKLEFERIDLMAKAAEAETEADRKKYQEAVTKMESRIEGTKQDAELQMQRAQSFDSVDAYKAALETMETRNNYLKSGVTETHTTEIIENIPYKAARQRIKDERDWWAQQDASSRGWATVNQGQQRIDLEKEKWMYDPKNPKAAALLPPTQTALALGTEYASQYGDLLNASAAADENMEKTKFDIVSKYMSAINFGNGRDLTKDQIEASIKKYEKDSPGFIDRMYGRAKAVSVDPKLSRSPLYSGLMSALPSAAQAENVVAEIGIKTKNMNNDPAVIAAGGKDIDLASIQKGYKPVTVTYKGESGFMGFGGDQNTYTKTITAQDALDLAIIRKFDEGFTGVYRTITRSDAEKAQYEKAEARIRSKFNVSGIDLLEKTGYVTPLGGGGGILAKNATNPDDPLNKVYRTVTNKKFGDVLAAKEAHLANNNWTPQPLAYNIYGDDMKEAERKSVDDRMKVVVNKYKGAGGMEEFNNLYTDPKNFTAQIQVNRGTTLNPKEEFTLNLYGPEGLVKSTPISRTDAEYAKGGGKIVLPPMASPTAQRIKASGEARTSNASGLPPNHPQAYTGALVPQEFYMQKLNSSRALGADVVESPSGGFNAYIYTKDNKGNTIGIPVKRNAGDIYPATFDTADNATDFLVNEINSKALLDSFIKNGL